ncbi:MAG: ATP-binding cassette domain-containing protein [Wenzhouxiangellaceae bacterium]|nr:ATP-binding cassette domain-containing protein [Wenzhouxiangellaceae bacterium]
MSGPVPDRSADPVVRVRGLVNRFDSTVVHDRLDLDVRRGEILGVVGGSGSGKSVLMRSILGLQRPQAGTVELFGRRFGPGDSRAGLEDLVGVLFQDGALFSSMTVCENVEVPLRAHRPELDERLRRQLALLKIRLSGLPGDAAGKLPSELSGGMRKRASLARALALEPDLLFLDEPTAGLDPVGAAGFDELIETLQESLGFTIFLITHDLDTLYRVCDRVAVLADRRVLACGPLEDIEALDHEWVREYFHGPRARAARRAGPDAERDG